jgi:hypothetical protein
LIIALILLPLNTSNPAVPEETKVDHEYTSNRPEAAGVKLIHARTQVSIPLMVTVFVFTQVSGFTPVMLLKAKDHVVGSSLGDLVVRVNGAEVTVPMVTVQVIA